MQQSDDVCESSYTVRLTRINLGETTPEYPGVQWTILKVYTIYAYVYAMYFDVLRVP
jgi:hypothetical protein